MSKFVCVHGHFYQPPRENPWLEEVEQQDSASPYHDWNERISAECYGPNTASRIVDGEGRIIDIMNNYSRISFNVGPTLFAWMDRHQPEVSRAIVEADRLSRERFGGHGSAMAQVFNHMIMPLANRTDKYTQAYWGIVSFEKKFGRYPDGIWLSETAVDTETLEVLAELKIRFVVLAPRQARRVKHISKGARWNDVKGGVDTTMPYLCKLPSGKSIALFFYDGSVSQDLAFGQLLNNGEAFANRLYAGFRDREGPQLVHVATDGESYGHHHRYGEMALSYCLHTVETNPGIRLTNYAEFLALHPPTHMAEIWDNSSWSCVHGVERWRENCGCNSGRQGWTQAWRKPLRDALDVLRDGVAPLFEKEASVLLADPWRARNEYIEVVEDRSRENILRFLKTHAAAGKDDFTVEERVRALKLLELQRNCMLMYTSCGWFFDEISGIETTQVLRYASEAIQFAGELFGKDFETPFVGKLAEAPSNTLENGAKVYEAYVKSNRLDLLRVGAHYAIASLFSEHKPRTALYCYSVETESYKTFQAGKTRLVIGRVKVTSDQTMDTSVISFAALHMGDQNISGGVRPFMGQEPFDQMQAEISAEFERGQMAAILQLMVKYFGNNNYSAWHLFRDEQRRVLDILLGEMMTSAGTAMRRIYEGSSSFMNLLRALGQPIPPELMNAATHVLNQDLRKEFGQKIPEMGHLEALVQQANRWSIRPDPAGLNFLVSGWINDRLEELREHPEDIAAFENVERVFGVIGGLGLQLDLWRAQNAYFAIGKGTSPAQKAKADAGDANAARWMELYGKMGGFLKVQVVA